MSTLKQLWPVAIIAIVSGGVNFLLLWLLGDGIDAYEDTIINNYSTPQRGGPNTLFFLNAGVMAWACISLLENLRGSVGIKVFVMAVPFWAIAISGGFALAIFVVGPMDSSTWAMLYVSVIAALGMGGLRAWYGIY